MDPRDSNRGTRKKSKWVQELIKEDTAVTPEVEHVVGRDQSEAMSTKSTTTASSAQGTKESAKNALNLKKKEENTLMEVELAEAIKKIRQDIKDAREEQFKMANLIYTTVKIQLDQYHIKNAQLEADNRYYSKVSDDVKELSKQLKKYKELFWGTIGTIIFSIIVIF